MEKITKVLLAAVFAVVIAGGAFLLFAPKGVTVVDDVAIAGNETAQGTFHDGPPGHHVSGSIKIVRSGAQYFARFENYSATPGPDVYLFLTPDPDARTVDDIEGKGLQLRVPGGAGDGQATLSGNFNVPLPSDFVPSKYRGAVVWCTTYNFYFGGAVLQ